MGIFLGTRKPSTRVLRFGVAAVAAFTLFQFVSLYLSWPKQIVLGSMSVVLALALNRASRSHVVTLGLMLVSLAATFRYGWWRVHMLIQFFSDESNSRFTIDSVLMLILISAEAYTILIMVLGFMQTSSPLRRKPIPLPTDESLWPDVDVLIPTYNEPLSLVRYTALAAVNIDYPPEKLHVYILDDGTRQSFRDFAAEAGVGYVVRPKHDHAKAGNINHALKQMSSPLVTIFDCDHVPTRSFLQVTVGWFLVQPKLAMLQTPHFFYSPDPFERNLLQYKTIPNEGELFYGVIQDGNDLWNATFFCGSCAVIRRAALNEVGGIATETVTEDAHTSLRMQKRGWNTAYINLPQAAGLATETLSAHVGQRVRWARGMIQILRTDNPLLARGMKFTQRLCYFNAMLHFMYAIPRLIFLCAPLIYMLGGRTIIPGYWLAILAYAMPHLIITSITNSRIQGKHRHSFWNEIYETVLAPYILMPTLLALINPKLGEFNVTGKGSTLDETTFDRHIAAPTTWLLGLNFVGLCVVPYRLLVTDPTHPGTVLSNLVWIVFNMVVLGVAAAVANEQQQRRSSVRIAARIPVRLHTEGATVSGVTEDMSVGGAALTFRERASFTLGQRLRISFPMQTGDATISGSVVASGEGTLRVRFDALTIPEQETLTCALYSRANSWITSKTVEEDRPLVSLARVVRLSFTGFHQVLRGLLPARAKPKAAAVLATLSMALLAVQARPQIPGAIVSNAHAVGAQATDPARAAAPAHSNASSSVVASRSSRPEVVLLTPMTPVVRTEEADQKITLKEMGVQQSIEMHGPHSSSSIGFVLDRALVPRRATLNLSYRFSSDLLPHTGTLKVTLNGTPIAEIAAPAEALKAGQYGFAALPLPAESLIRRNDLSFEFTGGTLLPLEANARSAVLGNIGASSEVLVAGERVAIQNDLGLLPVPFFDPELQTTTTIAFVYLSPPSLQTMRASGIVASWLGTLATARPLRFTTSIGTLPKGNFILLTDRPGSLPASLAFPGGGASLSLRINPVDASGSVLVLTGDDDAQLLNVARGLSLMTIAHPNPGQTPPLFGSSVAMSDFELPPARKPDDAPRWLSTQNLTSLWAFSSRDALRTEGGPLTLYLRVPPDVDYGENDNLSLRLAFRYNAAAVAPGSALRVFTNGSLIDETALQVGTDFVDRRIDATLPVALMRPFSNTLQFDFDFIPANPSDEGGNHASKLAGMILQSSALDIKGMDHWAVMPNLELFANAGFPFTRRADLADTVVVVPTAPTLKEIALFLYLMSHCGTQTGYPALRVQVAGPEAVMRADRDYLILGGTDDQPAFGSLDSALPVTLDGNGLHVKDQRGLLASMTELWRRGAGRFASGASPSNIDGMPDLMIEGVQSPFFTGRSIVAIALRNDEAVDEFAETFFERSQSSDIAHTLSILRDGRFTSYRMPTSIYRIGDISRYRMMRIWFADHFWVLLLLVTVSSMMVARYLRDYLALLSAQRLKVATSS